MFEFGTVYWKQGQAKYNSPEQHFLVVLAIDEENKQVWYQTLSSHIEHIFQFPAAGRPHIDVDAVAFLNYQKYSYLSKDTCIVMMHGVNKENKSVFEQNVQSGTYKLKGKIINHNKKSVLLSLKCATEHKLSEYERMQIVRHYTNCETRS